MKAEQLAKKYNTSFTLLEDGFIRSLGLGVTGSPSFSLVEDDVGIYYDANVPSKLENILNTYDFKSNEVLMAKVSTAITLIQKYKISKYNSAPKLTSSFINKFELKGECSHNILIIAQTAGDASLEYGMLEPFTTDEIIDAAIHENPEAQVFLKVHPDVISGKKSSDFNVKLAQERCTVIDEEINPIALLEKFSKVYTKTSGMGFEALLIGCECVCFGMPFYAGWGITDDRSFCSRRTRNLSVAEVFAASYILYTRYYNPYTKRQCDIVEAIEEIVRQRAALKDEN